MVIRQPSSGHGNPDLVRIKSILDRSHGGLNVSSIV